MDFNYTKIRLGNWLYRYFFPLYNYSYRRFKLKNDHDEIALLKQLIRPGDTVLDIGANIGFYARLLSEMTGEHGKVFCFEPDRKNFAHLQANVRKLRNVVIFNQAVSDRAGSLKVYKSKLLNVDHRTYPVSNYDSIEETKAVTIDELIENQIISPPQLVKIDIQGYELCAFKGMTALIESSPTLKIVTEFWPHGLMRAGVSALDLFDFFSSRGYCFYRIERDRLDLLEREYIAANNSRPFEFSFNVLIKRS